MYGNFAGKTLTSKISSGRHPWEIYSLHYCTPGGTCSTISCAYQSHRDIFAYKTPKHITPAKPHLVARGS